MEAKKNHNKQLAHKRSLFLSIGLCLSLFIIFSAFQLKSVPVSPIQFDLPSPIDYPVMIEIEATRFEKPKPPKVQPPTLITIVDDPGIRVFEDSPPIITLEDEILATMEIIEMPVEAVDEPDTFMIIEQPATFPGGMEDWQRFLQKNLKYPRKAQRTGIEGKVHLSFYVDAAGNISDIRVIRGIGAGCDKEAIRVLQNSPAWNPGLQRGVPVKSPMSLFIKFKLR